MQDDTIKSYSSSVRKFIRLDDAIDEYNRTKNPIEAVFNGHGIKKINNKIEALDKFDFLQRKIFFLSVEQEIDKEKWTSILENVRRFIHGIDRNIKAFVERNSIFPIQNHADMLKTKEEVLSFLKNLENVVNNFDKCTFDRGFAVQNLLCGQKALPRHVLDKCLELISNFKSRQQVGVLSVEQWKALKCTCLAYIEKAFVQEKDKKHQKSRLLPLTKIIELLDQDLRLERITATDLNISKIDSAVFVNELHLLYEERKFFTSVLMGEYMEVFKRFTSKKFAALGGHLQQCGKGLLTIDWEKIRKLTSPEDMGLCLRFEIAWNNNLEDFQKLLQYETQHKYLMDESSQSLLSIWQFYRLIYQIDSVETWCKSQFFNFETRQILDIPHIEKASRGYYDLRKAVTRKMGDRNYANITEDYFVGEIDYLKKYLRIINKIAIEFQQGIKRKNELYKVLYEKISNETSTIDIFTPEAFEQLEHKIYSYEELEEIYEKRFDGQYVDQLTVQGHSLLLDDIHMIFYGYIPCKDEQEKECEKIDQTSKKVDNMQRVVVKRSQTNSRRSKNKNKKLAARQLDARIKALSLEEKISEISEKVKELQIEEKGPLVQRKRKRRKNLSIKPVEIERASDITKSEKEKEVEIAPISHATLGQIKPRPVIEKRITFADRVRDWYSPAPQSLLLDQYRTLPIHIQNKIKLFHTFPSFMIRYLQNFGIRALQLSGEDLRESSYTLVGQIEPYGEDAHEIYNKNPADPIIFRGFFSSVINGDTVFHHCFTERPYNDIMEQVSRQGFITLDEEITQHDQSASLALEDNYPLDKVQSLNPDKERYIISTTAHTLCVDDLQGQVRYTICLMGLSWEQNQ